MEVLTIDRRTIVDLAKMIEEVNLRMESLELMSSPEVVEGHKRAKEQIKNRDFGSWDGL